MQTIFESHAAGNIDLQVAVQLAVVARFYERIGDHAVNIGERVRYLITGWMPEHVGAARYRARIEAGRTPTACRCRTGYPSPARPDRLHAGPAPDPRTGGGRPHRSSGDAPDASRRAGPARPSAISPRCRSTRPLSWPGCGSRSMPSRSGSCWRMPTERSLFRNSVSEHIAGSRHADVLVGEAVDALVAGAIVGRPRRQTLDLFGPPRRTLLLRADPIDGGQGGALVTVADETDRSRLDAVRTDFVANVSHELKTPVGAMTAARRRPGRRRGARGRRTPRRADRGRGRATVAHDRRPARALPDRARRPGGDRARQRRPGDLRGGRAGPLARLPPRHLDRRVQRAVGARDDGRPPAGRLRARQPRRERGEVLGSRPGRSPCGPSGSTTGSR